MGTAFFLAELGDKTMLATVTLATHEDALGTWLGSTAGMVAADAIAIDVGKVLGTRLPDRAHPDRGCCRVCRARGDPDLAGSPRLDSPVEPLVTQGRQRDNHARHAR
jgi:hypothetical protein